MLPTNTYYVHVSPAPAGIASDLCTIQRIRARLRGRFSIWFHLSAPDGEALRHARQALPGAADGL
jgi:hypothetical protein